MFDDGGKSSFNENGIIVYMILVFMCITEKAEYSTLK